MRAPRFERGLFIDQTPDAPLGPGGGAPESREKLFAGKNVIVTGGNRDIGRAIVLAFAAEGANVVSNYHRDNQAHHAARVVTDGKASGGTVKFTQVDFETDEGKVAFADFIAENFGDDTDIVVLSSSGSNPQLNERTDGVILDWFLTTRRAKKEQGEELKKGFVFRLNSVPGHFFPQLKDTGKIPDFYVSVADPKYEAEQGLRARISEFEELNVRLIIPTPPNVEDTQTVRAFRRYLDAETWSKHDELCDMLGLPHEVTTSIVAAKIIELTQRTDLPQGYVELFGDAIDARSAGLENWFGKSAIYVDTVERDENEEGGTGRFIVTKDQCDSQKDVSFKGAVVSVDQRNIVSELPITAGHARDHFGEGLGRVLPGHKTIRIAVNTMEQLVNHISGKNTLSIRLVGFESVSFSRPVLPNKTMRVSLTLAQGDASSREFQGRAEVTIDGQPAAVIEGLSCEVTDTPQDGLLEDQLIEAGIQAAGLVGLGANKMQERSLPAFARIGKAQFYERPKPGKAVWSAVGNIRKPSEERFVADVTLLSYGSAGEQIVGSFADAEALILTHARARRIFGQLAA